MAIGYINFKSDQSTLNILNKTIIAVERLVSGSEIMIQEGLAAEVVAANTS